MRPTSIVQELLLRSRGAGSTTALLCAVKEYNAQYPDRRPLIITGSANHAYDLQMTMKEQGLSADTQSIQMGRYPLNKQPLLFDTHAVQVLLRDLSDMETTIANLTAKHEKLQQEYKRLADDNHELRKTRLRLVHDNNQMRLTLDNIKRILDENDQHKVRRIASKIRHTLWLGMSNTFPYGNHAYRSKKR